MALFSSDTKDTKKAPAKKAVKKSVVSAKKAVDGREHMILRAPWLSEKALIGTENGVYVFQVPTDATKPQIAAAIENIYKVTPRAVRIVNLPAKKKAMRTRQGMGSRAARHKAYVSLKKGDTIQFA
ncbi:50S ribosomal protein L23 [Patescibacteria group bacterium]|nr:50S ribosomal protein L23 [Patescibacteria group bacterium]